MQSQKQRNVILLTGATGFLGSAVLRQIIQDGNLPIALVRPGSDLSKLENIQGFQSFTYDSILNDSLIDQLKQYKPTALIHVAWRRKGSKGYERNGAYHVVDNVPLALDSVRLAQAVGCSQWLGIGSREEYGNISGIIDESCPTFPGTVYGQAKLSACWATLGLCNSYGIKGSWVRCFSLYGLFDDPSRFITYVAGEISKGSSPNLTKCEQQVDYLYVDDAARGILSIIYQQVSGIFNLGYGQAISLKTIAETICELLNSSVKPNYGAIPYHPGQAMLMQADVTKIQQMTGWQPEVIIKQGLEMVVKEFQPFS